MTVVFAIVFALCILSLIRWAFVEGRAGGRMEARELVEQRLRQKHAERQRWFASASDAERVAISKTQHQSYLHGLDRAIRLVHRADFAGE